MMHVSSGSGRPFATPLTSTPSLTGERMIGRRDTFTSHFEQHAAGEADPLSRASEREQGPPTESVVACIGVGDWRALNGMKAVVRFVSPLSLPDKFLPDKTKSVQKSKKDSQKTIYAGMVFPLFFCRRSWRYQNDRVLVDPISSCRQR